MAQEQSYRHGALGTSPTDWPEFRDCSSLRRWISYPSTYFGNPVNGIAKAPKKEIQHRYIVETSSAVLSQFAAAEIAQAMLFQSNLGAEGGSHIVHFHDAETSKLLCNFYIGQFVSEEVVRFPFPSQGPPAPFTVNITFGASTGAEELWSDDGFEVGVIANSMSSLSARGVVKWTRTDMNMMEVLSHELLWKQEWRTAWTLFRETLSKKL
ncbi:hypothetical protein HDU93_009062 [Gonapodya sp. JEL0774]|nr:hypothetical protein HDU93_009062 [Gonapodya sp. JEL0774]